MKVIQYNAISVDGFIATKDGNTDWVSEADWEEFYDKVSIAEVVIMGRKTFEDFDEEDFPLSDANHYVMTSTPDKFKSKTEINFVNESPEDLIQKFQKQGLEKILVIGGGQLNASFLKSNLIDELIVSIHPIILGDGIRLFEGDEIHVDLEKVEVKEIGDGVVWVRYKVGKLPNH